MDIWVWGAVIVISLIVEFATVELMSIWFAVGGIGGLIFAICGLPIWSQIVVFTGVTGLTLLFTRQFFVKFIKRKMGADVNSLVNKEVVVMQEVKPGIKGTVKLNDVIWTAESENNFKIGEVAYIKEVKGNKLIISKKQILWKDDADKKLQKTNPSFSEENNVDAIAENAAIEKVRKVKNVSKPATKKSPTKRTLSKPVSATKKQTTKNVAKPVTTSKAKGTKSAKNKVSTAATKKTSIKKNK